MQRQGDMKLFRELQVVQDNWSKGVWEGKAADGVWRAEARSGGALGAVLKASELYH